MRVIVRTAIGMVLAAGGLTFLTYGVAQAVGIGSCGGYRAACPSGMGPLILLMVFGTFAALAGAALARVLARFILVLFVAVPAGVVLGFVDLDSTDTRPGPEIVLAVLVPMLLFALPGVGPRRKRAAGFAAANPNPVVFGAPPSAPPPASSHLDHLRDSGLMGDE